MYIYQRNRHLVVPLTEHPQIIPKRLQLLLGDPRLGIQLVSIGPSCCDSGQQLLLRVDRPGRLDVLYPVVTTVAVETSGWINCCLDQFVLFLIHLIRYLLHELEMIEVRRVILLDKPALEHEQLLIVAPSRLWRGSGVSPRQRELLGPRLPFL